MVGFVEGVSFLVLLGIAMPLKRLAGLPEAVFFVGWAHGILFMLYVGAIAHATLLGGLTVAQAAGGLVASVLPFGPFVYDSWLRGSVPPSAPPGSDVSAG